MALSPKALRKKMGIPVWYEVKLWKSTGEFRQTYAIPYAKVLRWSRSDKPGAQQVSVGPPMVLKSKSVKALHDMLTRSCMNDKFTVSHDIIERQIKDEAKRLGIKVRRTEIRSIHRGFTLPSAYAIKRKTLPLPPSEAEAQRRMMEQDVRIRTKYPSTIRKKSFIDLIREWFESIFT